MALPEPQSITVIEDQDITLRFTMQTAGVDWTAWAITFAAKEPDGDAFITKTVNSGITVVSATVLEVALSVTDIASPGPYLWSLRRTDAGFRVVLATGTLNLQKEFQG